MKDLTLDSRDQIPPITIHLVDDDSDTLVFLFDMLTEAGFRVDASSNTLDALGHVRRLHPKVIFCDVEMPEINGLEFLERMKRISPETRVVLMADKEGWLDHDDPIRQEGINVLLKPLTREAVLRAVERVMEATRS